MKLPTPRQLARAQRHLRRLRHRRRPTDASQIVTRWTRIFKALGVSCF